MKKIVIRYYLILRYLPFLLFGKKPKILSFDQTVEEIILNKKSFSRFGDGEIRLLLDSGEIGFQKRNLVLTEKLKEVLKNDSSNLLIGLPNTFRNIGHHTLDSQIFWYGFNMMYAQIFLKQLNLTKQYGDASITRFYMAYKNKGKDSVQKKIEKLKTIWKNQNILIIEGKKTKLGVGNDLFDNAASVVRILCPSKNAYDFYNIILQAASNYGRGKLILIALGPTASILASDLAKLNYWAIDIGHVDIEYLWFMNNAKTKIPIIGKYVQESKEQLISNETEDENYTRSIIKTLS